MYSLKSMIVLGIALIVLVLIAVFIQPAPLPVTPAGNISTSILIPSASEDFGIRILNGTSIEITTYSHLQATNFSAIPNQIPMEDYAPFMCNFSGNLSWIAEIALTDGGVRRAISAGGVIEGIYFYEPPCRGIIPIPEEKTCACSYPALKIRGPPTSSIIHPAWIRQSADFIVDEGLARVIGMECHYTSYYAPDSEYEQFCVDDCETETCCQYPGCV